MKNCEKCGKALSRGSFKTAYGEYRCENCWDDHLMTDKGKVEYFIGLCNRDYDMSEFDADFICHIIVCWLKYRDKLALTNAQIAQYEKIARELGLLSCSEDSVETKKFFMVSLVYYTDENIPECGANIFISSTKDLTKVPVDLIKENIFVEEAMEANDCESIGTILEISEEECEDSGEEIIEF
jgi:hypothetical protein